MPSFCVFKYNNIMIAWGWALERLVCSSVVAAASSVDGGGCEWEKVNLFMEGNYFVESRRVMNGKSIFIVS